MLLHSNKKSIDFTKPTKRSRPAPLLSINKIKNRLSDSPLMRGDPFRLAALDSLQPKCEGIKLNSRQLKSPQRKVKKLSKIYRADTTIKPLMLNNFQVRLSSSTSFIKDRLIPFAKLFIDNPQEVRNQTNLQIIPSNHLLIYQQPKYVQLKEKIAFYVPNQTYVGLHLCNQVKVFPKIQGVLQSLGICYLGQQRKKFIVSQLYLGHSFRCLMSEFGKFEECTARFFIKQLTKAVYNLHQIGYSHNRLNLDSIVHNCQGKLLINFFKSSQLSISPQQKQTNLHYLSPQIILENDKIINQKNDIWALGCITLQFLSSSSIKSHKLHPYNQILNRNENNQKQLILKSKLETLLQNNYNEAKLNKDLMSTQAEDFIAKCLELDIQKRQNASNLLIHPFLQE